jgi:hypothetical protein
MKPWEGDSSSRVILGMHVDLERGTIRPTDEKRVSESTNSQRSSGSASPTREVLM